MKSVSFALLFLFAVSIFSASKPGQPLTEKLISFGQTPAEQPLRFAPLLLKNEITPDTHVELHGTPIILPDGSQFFIEMQRKQSDTDSYRKTVMVVHYRDGRWQNMQQASFSGTYNDGTITLSHEGNRLYFSSDRPVPEHPKRQGRDLWFVERTQTGWSDPVHVDGLINSDRIEGSLVFAGKNRAYFFRRYNADDGSGDIVECTIKEGRFSEPERLTGTINSPAFEFPVLASDDGGWLIFYSNRDYPEKAGLYITFRDTTGEWQEPLFLPSEINNLGLIFTASLSPEGGYMFLLNRQPNDKPLSPETGEQPGGIYWLQFPHLLEKMKADFNTVNRESVITAN